MRNLRNFFLISTLAFTIPSAMADDAGFKKNVGYLATQNIGGSKIYFRMNSSQQYAGGEKYGSSASGSLKPVPVYFQQFALISSFCPPKNTQCSAAVYSIYNFCHYYGQGVETAESQCIASLLATYPNAKKGLELATKLRQAGTSKMKIFEALSNLSNKDSYAGYKNVTQCLNQHYAKYANSPHSTQFALPSNKCAHANLTLNPTTAETAEKYAAFFNTLTLYKKSFVTYEATIPHYCGVYEALSSPKACDIKSAQPNKDTLLRLRVCYSAFNEGNAANLSTLIKPPRERTSCIRTFNNGDSSIGSPVFPARR